MSGCDSIAKGAFAFRGRKRKLDATAYLADDDESSRHAGAVRVWSQCSAAIEQIQDASCATVFKEICAHVLSCYASRDGTGGGGDAVPAAAASRLRSAVDQLPAVALVSGACAPDHARLFARLVGAVRAKATRHVASLRSKDCGSLRALLGSVASQLAGAAAADPTEDAFAAAPSTRGAAGAAGRCTMSFLESWYKSVAEKERSTAARKPVVVIIVEDFEAFRSEVLQDFVVMCHHRMAAMPAVLVFGLATDSTVLHRALPNSVTSVLAVHKFQAVSANETLSLALERVLLGADAPFKLGSGTFELLLDLFLFHDFSVAGFARCLKFCVHDHFLARASGSLCGLTLDEAVRAVRTLGQRQLDELLALPSMRAFVESRPSGEKVQLLKDGRFARKVVEQLVRDLREYHVRFFALLRALHSLTSQLPGYPVGKQFRELYLLALRGITDTEGYKLSIGLLRNLSKDELISHLGRCIELVSEGGPFLASLRSELTGFVDRLQMIGHPGGVADASDVSAVASALSEPLPKKLDLYTLRKTLAEHRSVKSSPFDRLRTEILDFLDGQFRDGLKPYSGCPLHEVYYYDDAASVRQHCNASSRMAIHKALTKPFYYIENESCDVSAESIVSSLPDVCIAYKLHLQCGRLINLHDWMVAFAAVCDDGHCSDRKTKVSNVIQARFVQAVSELQFLGFVKPTRAKTDHVTRLTWGTC